MLKGALIGFGTEAEKYFLPAFAAKPGIFKITAASDISAGRRRRAAELLRDAKIFSGPEDLFSAQAGLDFALISLPPLLRAKTALRALDNRLHVICPPPLCFTMKDLDAVRQKAFEKEKTVFIAHDRKKCPQVRALSELLGRKILGEIQYAEFHSLTESAVPAAEESGETTVYTDAATPPACPPGQACFAQPAGGPLGSLLSAEAGVVMNQGWHAFYLLCGLLGLEPVSMSAKIELGADRNNTGAPQSAACHLHFPGLCASVYLSVKSHATMDRAIIYGSRGSACLDDDILRLDIKGMKPETIRFKDKISSDSSRARRTAACLEDFEKEITGPELRYESLKEAKTCLKLAKNACYSDSLHSAAVPL